VIVMIRLANLWQRFWHDPLRAERLGLTRVLFAAALLGDQLFQYLPYLADFYGPTGIAPAGLNDDWALQTWRWTVLLFNTDDMHIVVPLFWTWVAATFLFLVGWHTRWISILVWFLTLCFHNRNTALLNFGDDLLRNALFLLMISPCGCAFSIDAWRQRRQHPGSGSTLIPAWPVRLLQIQLCMMYFSTGLAKLVREPDWFTGTWWDGTSMHYVLNIVTRARWSFAQLPLPLWVTAPMTYSVVAWEVLFPLLVLFPRTRKWALWFGVLLHLGILATIEIGWFSFYSLAMYGVWIPFPLASARPTSPQQGGHTKTLP